MRVFNLAAVLQINEGAAGGALNVYAAVFDGHGE